MSKIDILELLPTGVRHTLATFGVTKPQNLTIPELMRIPRIGPGSVKIIAEVIQKHRIQSGKDSDEV